MVSLLDANVLLALVWSTHVHHRPARSWFADAQSDGWATVPFTEVAFVRLSSNPAFSPSAPPPPQAVEVLRAIRSLAGHRFLEDPQTFATNPFTGLLVGHQQVTDCHLLALAHHHGVRLVTFDQGVARLIPSDVDTSQLLLVLRG